MDRYLRVSHLNIHQQSKKHTLNPTFALSMRFCAPFPWFIIEPILPDLSITKTNSPWVARDDITSSGNSGYKLIMTTGSLIREPEKERKSQIKSLLLSHHHSTSALVSEILMSVLQTVQKKKKKNTTTTIYIWTDSAKKTTNNLHMDSTYLQTVQKTMCKIHIHILSTHSVL